MNLAAKLWLIAVAVGFTATAEAMTCSRKAPSDIAEGASVAFIGRVLSIEDSDYSPRPSLCWKATQKDPECGGKIVTLEVTRALRGDLSGRTTVLSEDACYCVGPSWRTNETFLVVATPNPTKYAAKYQATDSCGGTRPLSDVGTDEVVRALEKRR